MIHLGSLFSVNFPSIATTFIWNGVHWWYIFRDFRNGRYIFEIVIFRWIYFMLVQFCKSVVLCLSSWRFFSDRFVTFVGIFTLVTTTCNILILKIDDAMKHPTTMDAAMTENSFSRSGYLLSEIAQVHPSNVEFWNCLKNGTLLDVAKWSVH